MQQAHNKSLPLTADLPMDTDAVGDLHTYERTVNRTGKDVVAEVARLISPGATVLELGAATGALSRYLTINVDCLVDGVAHTPREAEDARKMYRALHITDLQSTELGSLVPHHSYDFIVCTDILEHLRDPGYVVQQLPALLAEGGKLVISVPNFGYLGLIAEILSGEFRYRSEGILANTHLHFFTNKSLRRLLHENGFRVLRMDAIEKELQETEFAAVHLEQLPPILQQRLAGLPDSKSYQFIVEAVPGIGPDLDSGAAATPSPSEWYFTSVLRWQGVTEGFRPLDMVSVQGRIGDECQELTFQLPDLHERITLLRLDLADRPGYMRLHSIRLANGQGDVLWQWTGAFSELAPTIHGQVLLAPSAGPDNSVIAYLTGHEALLLPIPEPILAHVTPGSTLTIEAGWPMSGDFVALSRRMDESETEELIRLRDREEAAEQKYAAAQEELLRVRGALDQINAERDAALLSSEASDRATAEMAVSQHERDAFLERLIAKLHQNDRRMQTLSAELWSRDQELATLRTQASTASVTVASAAAAAAATFAASSPKPVHRRGRLGRRLAKRIAKAIIRRMPRRAKRIAKAIIRRTPVLRRILWRRLWTPAPALLSEEEIIRATGLFDVAFYLEHNPDVSSSGQDPLQHFVSFGASEGRNPNPLFDVAFYLRAYPDVAVAGVNPLAHYITHGAREGRNPHPCFDTHFYLTENPDVAVAGVNPLAHYITRGAREGRNPSPLFDASVLLRAIG